MFRFGFCYFIPSIRRSLCVVRRQTFSSNNKQRKVNLHTNEWLSLPYRTSRVNLPRNCLLVCHAKRRRGVRVSIFTECKKKRRSRLILLFLNIISGQVILQLYVDDTVSSFFTIYMQEFLIRRASWTCKTNFEVVNSAW